MSLSSSASLPLNPALARPAEQLGNRGVALILAALIFVSVATIKDLLPVRPLAGSLHPQDLLKAAVFLAGGIAALSASNWRLKSLWSWPTCLALLFLGWCLATAPISSSPKAALLGAGLLAQMVLFAPYALAQLGPERIQRILVTNLLGFLLASTAVYLCFPSHNLLDPSEAVRLAGLTHSNSMGQMAGFMVIAALCLYDQSRLSLKALIGLCCVALVVFVWAQSRTPALGTVAAVGMYCWRRGTYNARSAVRVATLACLGGVVVVIALFVLQAQPPTPWVDSKSLLTRSGSSDELATLTGRDVIWEFALKKIQQRPLAGYGYGSSPLIFFDAYEVKDLHHNYGSAHNLVLEVALNTGWIGAGIICFSLLALLGLFFTRPCLFPDLVLVFLLITGITEATLFGPVPGPATILWLLALHWRVLEMAPRQVAPATPWRALPLVVPSGRAET